ncbi:MAG: ABC transporter substrate-binding protein [Actinomycetia bacterium]|nr:ABC transporter substrate-binding protein [Actinomycetes bacterium]
MERTIQTDRKPGIGRGSTLWRGLATVLATVLVTGYAGALTGCSTGSSGNANVTKTYQIGVLQPVEHPSLDTIYKGFQEGLKEQGYADKVKLDFQNAQGDQNNMNTIAQRFVADKKDLVLAIATPAAQAIAAQTKDIPVVGAAITSFTAAKLVESNERPGGNVTGVSDMAPVDAQVALIIDLAPQAKTVGFLYNSGEANSVEQVGLIRKAVEAKGLKTTELTVTSSNDVQQVAQALVKKCDVIYSPTDNTVASAMPTVAQVANAAKIPVIVGADSMVTDGGLATAGVNYTELGKKAAAMAVDILKGAKPADMPIKVMTNEYQVVINKKVATLLGITIPDKYKDAQLVGE